ncbi:MAG: DUF374 domain-containing protein [Pseudomonadota bacterium]
MSLRRRIEKSERLAAVLARVARAYLAFCDRTTRWHVEGLAALEAALANGPVLLVMWHERSLMAALHWPVAAGPLSSLYAKSPVGRVSGALQRSRGLQAMEMSDKTSNVAASRQILKRVKAGVSIGMTGDGPLGPALELNNAPLEWARVTGIPVFCYAFSTTRHRRLSTWDRMMVPKPFGRGAKVFARFGGEVPKRMSAEEMAALQSAVSAFVSATTAQADSAIGLG